MPAFPNEEELEELIDTETAIAQEKVETIIDQKLLNQSIPRPNAMKKVNPASLLQLCLMLLCFMGTALAADTCTIRQQCIREPGQEGMPCPDPTLINNPVIENYAPYKVQFPSAEYFKIQGVCPFIDVTQDEICCNED